MAIGYWAAGSPTAAAKETKSRLKTVEESGSSSHLQTELFNGHT
jgi:hypothetical protein